MERTRARIAPKYLNVNILQKAKNFFLFAKIKKAPVQRM